MVCLVQKTCVLVEILKAVLVREAEQMEAEIEYVQANMARLQVSTRLHDCHISVLTVPKPLLMHVTSASQDCLRSQLTRAASSLVLKAHNMV